MTKTKKDLRPWQMIAAAIFLFHPNINLVDVLPDCFGYLLLCLSIRGVSELVPHFEEGRRGFLRLFWVTLSKIPVYFIMTGLIGDNRDQRVLITLMSLSYGLVEVILLLSALREFFAGMDYLGERYGAPSAAGQSMANAKSAFTLLAIVKPALAFLPELCYLSMYEHFGYVDGSPDILLFRPLFVGLAVLVGLAFGVYFLCSFIPAAAALQRDPSLAPLLSDIRERTQPPLRGATRIRRMKLATTLLAVAFFCLIDLVFDGINYLPNLLGLLLMAAAAFLLLPLSRRAIYPLVGALVTAPFSVLAYLSRAEFFAEYDYEALGRWRAADALYDQYELFTTLEGVCQVLTFLALAYLLLAIIRGETGFSVRQTEGDASHKELHRTYYVKTAVLTALASLSAVASVVDVFLRRMTETYKQGTPMGDNVTIQLDGVSLPIYGWFWLITLLLRTLAFAYACHFAVSLSEEVEHKYSLD